MPKMSGEACYQGLECTSSNLERPQCARPSDTKVCSGGMVPALGKLMVSGGTGPSPPGHSVIAVSGWHEKKHRRGTPELSGTKIPMGWSYSKSFTVSYGPNRQKAFWCSGPQPLRGVSVWAGGPETEDDHHSLLEAGMQEYRQGLLSCAWQRHGCTHNLQPTLCCLIAPSAFGFAGLG